MRKQFRFQIIDGSRPGKQPQSSAPASSSRGSSPDKQLIHHLVGEAPEDHVSRVMEGFQSRLVALLEDRLRTGRHLTDDVLRPLFTIRLSLETHRQTCTSASSEVRCFCARSIAQLNEVIHDTRRLIRGLEEGEVQEFDLTSELYSMIKTFEAIGGLHIELFIESGIVTLLTQEENRELLTITREALNNCIRHAQATRATVKLRHSKARIYLIILDNGVGFSSSESHLRGYGLSNMESRARKLGGRLQVQSQKGRGTTIIAEFGLEPV